jgi:ribose-phosphate pyrophosphokinase
MELLVIADALRRSSAARITAVVPYYGYARQDRRQRSQRVPISAKLTADMITAAGINQLVTVDLHADQIQGFFNIPVDNVYASPVMLGDIWRQTYQDKIVVSPDVGGVLRARAVARRLDNADLAIIDKRRPRANEMEVMNIICQAASALKERGAGKVVAYITHPVLSGPAIERIENGHLDELIVTDSIPLSAEAAASTRIRQLSLAEMLAETMRRVNNDESVSELFVD